MNLSCEQCADLLLEHLYGVLDPPEAEAVREHLQGCMACQQALELAKAQQRLLAQAALKFREVPAFKPPTQVQALARTDAPSTIPYSPRRTMPWRRWAGAAIAATLLLAVGVGYAGYQGGLETRQQALASARQKVESIDAKLAGLTRAFMTEQATMASTLEGKFLNVNVVGPATYNPAATNPYRVSALTPTGKPAEVDVTVKLTGPSGETLYSQKDSGKGDLQTNLPANLKVKSDSPPKLTFEVSAGAAKESIEQPLTVEQPSYVTHIAMNRTVFRPGESVLFRTVTLDRFSLIPVAHQVTLACTLSRVGPAGDQVLVKELRSITQAGGIAGGEFIVSDEMPDGDYLFTVGDAGMNQAITPAVQPASRVLRVERTDKNAGTGKTILDQNKQNQTRLNVEFFPEGGDLLAGVANRVFVRLQIPPGLGLPLEAVLEDAGQKEIAKVDFEKVDPLGGLTLGSFTFTPRLGELYRVRLSAGGKQLDRFPLPRRSQQAFHSACQKLWSPQDRQSAPGFSVQAHSWRS